MRGGVCGHVYSKPPETRVCATHTHTHTVSHTQSHPHTNFAQVALLYAEQANVLQAQLVGWTMELQDRLEQAEMAVEVEDTARWRQEATLSFFAGEGDY